MQAYVVIEYNGESYEDARDWPVAVFDTQENAEEYAKFKQIEYDANFLLAEVQSATFDEEYYKLVKNLNRQVLEDNEQIVKLYNNLMLKYPLASMDTYSKHTFSVSGNTIPFNPTFTK